MPMRSDVIVVLVLGFIGYYLLMIHLYDDILIGTIVFVLSSGIGVYAGLNFRRWF
jgi:hypothetical protein